MFETTVTVNPPAEKISSKISSKYLTFTFGEITLTFGDIRFTLGEMKFTLGDLEDFRVFGNFLFHCCGWFWDSVGRGVS